MLKAACAAFNCKRGLIQVKSQRRGGEVEMALDCKRGLIQVKSQHYLDGGDYRHDCKRG